MALTKWNPNTTTSRGNVLIGIAPIVADINNPTKAELEAGLGIECSMTDFNGTSSVNSETIDWLCDKSSEELPGTITHSIDDLTIKATGQDDNELINTLRIGQVIYVWRRDGLPRTTNLAANQKVWVWKATVTSIDPLSASNTYIGVSAHVSVQARTATPVAVK